MRSLYQSLYYRSENIIPRLTTAEKKCNMFPAYVKHHVHQLYYSIFIIIHMDQSCCLFTVSFYNMKCIFKNLIFGKLLKMEGKNYIPFICICILPPPFLPAVLLLFLLNDTTNGFNKGSYVNALAKTAGSCSPINVRGTV